MDELGYDGQLVPGDKGECAGVGCKQINALTVITTHYLVSEPQRSTFELFYAWAMLHGV